MELAQAIYLSTERGRAAVATVPCTVGQNLCCSSLTAMLARRNPVVPNK